MCNRKKTKETKAAVSLGTAKQTDVKSAIAKRGWRTLGLLLSMALLAVAVTGCGSAGDDMGASRVEVIPVGEQGMDADGDRSSSEEPKQDMEKPQIAGEETGNTNAADTEKLDTEGAEAEVAGAGNEQLLCGSIRSIGENSIVISQSFEETDNEDPDASIMVEPIEGSPEEILIQVDFSEDTVFEVKTVKNGGVNGDSDVERTEGSIADLKEQSSVELTGNYEGADFRAKKVVIYRFV